MSRCRYWNRAGCESRNGAKDIDVDENESEDGDKCRYNPFTHPLLNNLRIEQLKLKKSIV